ncbi:acylphosphatase [Pseudomonas sp. SORGH_AS199]|uniref:hypothetical protein n=1 Tax=Pseudomonas sp. SORGH_AS_0199 TaxID=3041761 RepID=UPI0028581691|nr:hypothetical protein [Pseudomonas sp. SORGH_AS_0199]MDR6230434.1 acylphosphatase [Pseudomonas sp. SORGH_AS_0199]
MRPITDVQRLVLQDGEVFILPAGASFEEAERLCEAIQTAKPGVLAVVVIGELEHLDQAALNRAGWYRQ